jgi:hypothetical protein
MVPMMFALINNQVGCAVGDGAGGGHSGKK